MIYSVFNYDTLLFNYYQAPGAVPPHGWFRKPTPGTLKQPEEMAACLPAGAIMIGSGKLPKGVIATDMQGVGTSDNAGIQDGRGAGLGSAPQRRVHQVPVNAWESPNSRGLR